MNTIATKMKMMLKVWALLVALIGYSNCATVSPKAANFNADFLAAHNSYRKLHGCGPLVYNATLNKFAQNYANQLAARDVMQHSGGPYGENLYSSWSSVVGHKISGKVPVAAWYNEISAYNYAAHGFSMATGHFTQVVWKATTQLGVGVARSAKNSIYVVGEYWPRGNTLGKFPANVPKKI